MHACPRGCRHRKRRGIDFKINTDVFVIVTCTNDCGPLKRFRVFCAHPHLPTKQMIGLKPLSLRRLHLAGISSCRDKTRKALPRNGIVWSSPRDRPKGHSYQEETVQRSLRHAKSDTTQDSRPVCKRGGDLSIGMHVSASYALKE